MAKGRKGERGLPTRSFLPMKPIWALALGVASLVAIQGCKRKEPIPGPKAGVATVVVYAQTATAYARAPGIAYFQGSLDEAFANSAPARNCREYGVAMPRTAELGRARKKLNLPSPEAAPIMRP